ncbi:MAG: class II aldolase/adducin family protein [Anaerolineae bacterium]|nr:class II aldolase/adducin family protein [Anaerolineae bacterium]
MSQDIAERIVRAGRLMFERHLTDLAGGNITVRHEDVLYCSPRYAGTRHHWNLRPEDIVIGPLYGDDLVNHPRFTREGLSHLAIYRAYPFVRAVIHAHPRHVLPFCAFEKPIHPVLRGTQKYGVIGFIDHAPNYSQQQADSIVAKLQGQEERMQSSAAALLMPQHGIILAGVELETVLDALERIDTNAWCILAGQTIPPL